MAKLRTGKSYAEVQRGDGCRVRFQASKGILISTDEDGPFHLTRPQTRRLAQTLWDIAQYYPD